MQQARSFVEREGMVGLYQGPQGDLKENLLDLIASWMSFVARYFYPKNKPSLGDLVRLCLPGRSVEI